MLFRLLAFAGAVHAFTLKEPEHGWREEAALAAAAAEARKQELEQDVTSACRSSTSTLVAPSPISPVSSEVSSDTAVFVTHSKHSSTSRTRLD